MRIAAFGFRTIPPTKGGAGADKFAMELFPRLVKRGHSVVAYNRKYKGVDLDIAEYKGVTIRSFRTVAVKGFDTIFHSFRASMDIILKNTADVVHIQNGGNSIWALPLRLFGKKVFISQDGADWKRDKWPWYGKLYLKISSLISAYVPNEIIFDNVIAKRYFEDIFKKKFSFIPFGSEIEQSDEQSVILDTLGLKPKEYFLFVGRFIPDKGLHYLVKAYNSVSTEKKLVLVGGSPNPSPYEKEIKTSANQNVIFTGFIYGQDVTHLMKNAYCYIQPSDVEGLSPVILSVMGLGTPLLVSDIEENIYAVQDTATTFTKSDPVSLAGKIKEVLANPDRIAMLAVKAQDRALTNFSWDRVTDEHIELFARYLGKKERTSLKTEVSNQ